MNKNQVPISKALSRLVDTIKWDVENDFDISTINWYDENVSRPSNSEIETVREQIANEYNQIEYAELRKFGRKELVRNENNEIIGEEVVEEGYPSIEEQLDILYHQGYDGWKNSIKAVKDKFPKPE